MLEIGYFTFSLLTDFVQGSHEDCNKPFLSQNQPSQRVLEVTHTGTGRPQTRSDWLPPLSKQREKDSGLGGACPTLPPCLPLLGVPYLFCTTTGWSQILIFFPPTSLLVYQQDQGFATCTKRLTWVYKKFLPSPEGKEKGFFFFLIFRALGMEPWGFRWKVVV